MGQQTDFLIRDGVLKKYKGAGGTVVIPEGVEIIGEKAFYRRGDVREVIMPAGIIEIRDKAFEQCDELESINLPDSLKEIGERAFFGCGVKSVSIPDGVTKIGARAYENCRRMENIMIGSGLEEISEGMLSRCWWLKDVKIPESVSVIGQLAFEDSGLQRIAIPGSIRIIKADAFRSCSHLTELYIDSIESWCEVRLGNAWSHPLYQTSLSGRWQRSQDGKLYVNGVLVSEVQIPDGITALSGCRFCNCSNIRVVSIPESVKQIEDKAFAGCRLKAVCIRSLEAWCAISFTTGYVYSYPYNPLSGADLVLNGDIVTDLQIPESVTRIPKYAFYGCRSIKTLTLPEGVKEIGENTFSCCGNLKKVTVPEGVEKIGAHAFSNCEKLTGVELPDRLQCIEMMTFQECSMLKTVKLPAELIMIDRFAFQNCRMLSDITFPPHLTSIGDDAFSGCGFRELKFPDSVKRIGGSAFYACKKLKHVVFPKNLANIEAWTFRGCDKLDEVVLPKAVQHIGSEAFADCSSLKHVSIPDGIADASDDAFENCRLAVTVPSWQPEITKLFSKAAITGIHTNDISLVPEKKRPLAAITFAMEEQHDLTSERAGSHMGYIKRNSGKLCPEVFDDPKALYFLCEHQLISAKDYDLFAEEAGRRNDVELKALLMSYQNTIGMDSLTQAREKKQQEKDEYQNRLTERALDWTEKGISGLTFVVTGKLSQWSSRDELKAYLTEYGAHLGSGVSKTTDYLVTDFPESATEKIKKATALGAEVLSEREMNLMIGKRFPDQKQIVVPGWIKRIEESAFLGCAQLETVILPEGLEEIGREAFYGRDRLKQVRIPDGVTKIDAYAFKGCTRLEEIAIPESVTEIGYGAFNDCRALKEVTVPDGVTALKICTFEDCRDLQRIRIPDGVTKLGFRTFFGCSSLKSLSLPERISGIECEAFVGTPLYENGENWEDGVLYLGKYLIKAKEQLKGDYTVRPGTVCIADQAFAGCKSLTGVRIPESVQYIGNSAFSDCENLSTVKISGSLTEVGERAFYNCGSVRFDCYDPNSLTLVREKDFQMQESTLWEYNGTGGDVIIPKNVKAIGHWGFRGCSTLKNVTIPETVRSIDRDAFRDLPDVVIHAPKGSYAVRYARRQGIQVVET